MTKSRLAFLLIAILFLASCTPGDTQSPAEVQVTTPPQPAETVAELTDAPTSTAAAVETAPSSSPTVAQPAATTPAATAVPDPDEAEAPENTETEVAINGRTDDGAYFLGRADAPVTIVDYSDFL